MVFRSMRPKKYGWGRVITLAGATLSLLSMLWAAFTTPCVDLRLTIQTGSNLACLSLLEFALPLFIAALLWGMGVWVGETVGRPTPSAFFFFISSILSWGLRSMTGSDLGYRLLFPGFLWAAPLQYLVHWDLINRPTERAIRAKLTILAVLAGLLSLPSLLWSREILSAHPLGEVWRASAVFLLLVSLGLTLALLIWHYHHDWREVRRRPIRLILFGDIAGLMPLILLSILPRSVQTAIRLPFEMTLCGLLFIPVMYAYASMRYRHERLGQALKQIATFFCALTLFGALVIWGLIVVHKFAPSRSVSQTAFWHSGISGLAMLGTLALSQPLARMIERIWYGQMPDYAATIERLARSLAATLDRTKLELLLVHELRDVMALSFAALFLRDRRWRLRWAAGDGVALADELGDLLDAEGPLAAYLRSRRGPVAHQEVRANVALDRPSPLERWLLDRSDIGVWVPLNSEKLLLGFILLGNKVSEDLFTTEDYRILTTLAHQASIAAENVRLVEEMAAQEERLAQATKMETIGRLAAGIAHDFNNILMSILGYTYLIRSRNDLALEVYEDLDVIYKEGERASRLVRQILDFARKSIVQFRPLDLVSFLKETIKFLQRTLPESIHIVLEVGAEDYVIHSDPGMMNQVLTNLALNAVDAMPEGGELRVALRRLSFHREEDAPLQDMQPGEWVVLSVHDTGTGIPENVLPYIFEPFFTTKEVGKGTGLGLAQVYGIVKQHGGYIAVDTAEGAGTTFTIYLPAMTTSAEEEQEAEPEQIVLGHGETILLVEDEPVVLDTIKRMLERANYRVLSARNAQQALQAFEHPENEIALLLTDIVMPGSGGWELIKLLHRRHPELRALLITGYPLKEEGQDLLLSGSVRWIQKPVTAVALSRYVAQVLAQEPA
ncbi:MAG: response regulator [Chloroflexi bacterium]|nr:response regulator [Chloroflexota bacterium]